MLNSYSNSVSNKVESRRDETLLRTELRTNSATVNNEEYFMRNFGWKIMYFSVLLVTWHKVHTTNQWQSRMQDHAISTRPSFGSTRLKYYVSIRCLNRTRGDPNWFIPYHSKRQKNKHEFQNNSVCICEKLKLLARAGISLSNSVKVAIEVQIMMHLAIVGSSSYFWLLSFDFVPHPIRSGLFY